MSNATEIYEHHGREVHVISSLKGSHRTNCLCWQCGKMKPGDENHCPIAQALYAICVEHGLTTPVYECPKYVVAT